MRRGDVVTVAAGSGFGGKPRPALVVQADEFALAGTVVLALFTTSLNEMPYVRPRFQPGADNGLVAPSELMVDILITTRREKVGKVVGRLSGEDIARANRALLLFLGLTGEG